MAFKGIDVRDDKKTGLTFEGKEIILSKTRGRPREGRVERLMEQGQFPVTKQQEAALLYAVTGNLELSSEKSGVPIVVIKKWSKEPWFEIILREFREENLKKLDSAFTDVIDKAIVEIKDRLENGDWYVVPKTGQLVRRPVAIRDLAIVQAINIDKRQLIRGEPTARTESNQVPPEQLLENLAKKFTQIIEDRKNKRSALTIIEGEIEDAVVVESPSQPDGSSGSQLQVRQEGGSSN